MSKCHFSGTEVACLELFCRCPEIFTTFLQHYNIFQDISGQLLKFQEFQDYTQASQEGCQASVR